MLPTLRYHKSDDDLEIIEDEMMHVQKGEG